MTKTCKQCGETKPFEHFSKAGKDKGVQRYKRVCKDCTNEQMRATRGTGRVHFEHAQVEFSPHPKDIVKLPVLGWGYAGVIR